MRATTVDSTPPSTASDPATAHWLQLAGAVCLVTGAASGIGAAIARELAACGARVTVADLSVEAGEALVRDLGPGHRYAHCDVADPSSVQTAIEALLAAEGRIDVLVNNAGINIPRLLVDPAGGQELDLAVWNRVLGINLTGPFLCAQAAARAMVRQGAGVIINMASESGNEGSEGQSGYAATKAAMVNCSRSWAKELGPHGVRCVGVAPGIMEATSLRSEAYEQALAYTRGRSVEDLRASYGKAAIPLQRDGRVTEVADLVAFLASPRASYITGTTITISGGKSR